MTPVVLYVLMVIRSFPLVCNPTIISSVVKHWLLLIEKCDLSVYPKHKLRKQITMTKIYNYSSSNQVKDFLMPSWVDVITYIFLSAVFLTAINGIRLWHTFFSGTPAGQGNQDLLQSASSSPILSLAGDATVILFWVAVGSLIYMIIWLTQNSLSEIKHEIGGQMVSGDNVKRNYLNSVAAHYMFFTALTVVTLSCIYFLIAVILPLINAAFYGTIITFSQYDPINILSGFAAVVLMAIILYVFKLLIQVYIRFWRMYIRAQ